MCLYSVSCLRYSDCHSAAEISMSETQSHHYPLPYYFLPLWHHIENWVSNTSTYYIPFFCLTEKLTFGESIPSTTKLPVCGMLLVDSQTALPSSPPPTILAEKSTHIIPCRSIQSVRQQRKDFFFTFEIELINLNGTGRWCFPAFLFRLWLWWQ